MIRRPLTGAFDDTGRLMAVQQLAGEASFVSPWTPPPLTIAALGDSHINLGYNEFSFPGVLQGVTRLGFVQLANFMAGCPLQWLGDFGVTGERTDQIRARMATQIAPLVMAKGLRFLVLEGVANDLAQLGQTDANGVTITAASIIANIQGAVNDARALGLTVLLMTGFPRANPTSVGFANTAMTAGQIAALLTVNQAIRNLCATQPGAILVDVFPCFVDTSSAANMAKCLPDATLLDAAGLHINSFEATYRVALVFLRVFRFLVARAGWQPELSFYDGTSGDPNSLVKPMNGTGGALGAGMTGAAAINAGVQRYNGDATSTGVCSVITRQTMFKELGQLADYDGVPGVVQKVSITTVGAAGCVMVDNNWATALLPAAGQGKTVVAGVELAARITSAGATDTIEGFGLNANCGTRNEYVFDDSRTLKLKSCPQVWLRMQTQPFTIAPTEAQKINPVAYLQVSNGATADLYVSGLHVTVDTR